MFLLDMNIVGWDEQVDLDLLDIGRCTRCILGQLVGWESSRMYEILSLPNPELAEDFDNVCSKLAIYGFSRFTKCVPDGYNKTLGGDELFFYDLNHTWKKAILDRRNIRAIIQDMEDSVAQEHILSSN